MLVFLDSTYFAIFFVLEFLSKYHFTQGVIQFFGIPIAIFVFSYVPHMMGLLSLSQHKVVYDSMYFAILGVQSS